MLIQVRGIIETNMEKGMQHFGKEGYRGVTETWNVVQHEVLLKIANLAMTQKLLTLYASTFQSSDELLRRPGVQGLDQHDLLEAQRRRARLLLSLRH